MATTTIFGVPHHYQFTTEGTGAPFVFIHGWLLSHSYWQPVMHQLVGCYPCLAYDLRGFGESRYHLDRYEPGLPPKAEAIGASDSPYGLAAYARDLAALLKQLNLGPVWLVGHSLGGSIALWTAYCYPELVQGVICLNSGGGIYIERDFQQFRRAGQQIVRWRSPWLGRVPVLPLLLTRMMVAKPLPYHWGWQRCRDMLCAHPAAALGSLLESTTEAEVHLLPRIVSSLTQPVYFITGRQDRVMGPTFVYHLAGYLAATESGSKTVFELDNCGHMAMIEQPQAVVDVLKTMVLGPNLQG